MATFEEMKQNLKWIDRDKTSILVEPESGLVVATCTQDNYEDQLWVATVDLRRRYFIDRDGAKKNIEKCVDELLSGEIVDSPNQNIKPGGSCD